MILQWRRWVKANLTLLWLFLDHVFGPFPKVSLESPKGRANEKVSGNENKE